MNKIILVAVASLAFPIFAAGHNHERNETTHAIADVLAGSTIGAICGVLCADIDHKIPRLWPLTWLASMYIRTAAVNYCNKNMQKTNDFFIFDRMSCFSFFASWILYLQTYRHLCNPS